MTLNVMLQLCKITRASKLFQRNFYLPLLKPLSPKDALRRHIITGKNILSKMEHYIPVLEEYQARQYRRKYTPRGLGKKRQRKKPNKKYVMPFFDEDMDGHPKLLSLLSRKPKGRGQCYTYEVPDKNCTLVLNYQFERAIRDKEIIDVMMAQRTEKIAVVLKDGSKVSLPIVTYDGNAPFYRGEGWTRKEIEETHHHGKETMSVAKLFEAKESGVEEWELEMMRMAAKRKKKHKGEGTADWKAMMAAQADNIDWDKFEEDAKQMVEEQHDPVDDTPIPMAVDDMDKTKNVIEKIKNAGEEITNLLPVMPEIPEIINIIKDEGELTEIANVSGLKLELKSSKKERFVPGQMVKSEDGELFVPGQTVTNEEGQEEYTPGFTVMLEDEPTLIPGLVMGDDPNKAVFLPGDSTITQSGELQFTETEDDYKIDSSPPLPELPEVEEVELEEEQNSEDEEIEIIRPPPKREKKEFVYERPKRQFTQSMGPKRRERGPKGPKGGKKLSVPNVEAQPVLKKSASGPVLYDLSVPLLEKDLLQQQKERVENFTEKKAKEEVKIDKTRLEIRKKLREMAANKPPKPKYVPLEPVVKSEKLKELERSIKRGNFFDVDHKKYLSKERSTPFNWLEPPQYRNIFDSVGIWRHRIWKSWNGVVRMPINVKISLCKITRASKLFQRNYYLPLLKPLSPKDALRRKIITGQNVLGNRIEHYIPVLKPHDEKLAEKRRRGKGAVIVKKRIKRHQNERYVEPFLDDNMDNHAVLQKILSTKSKGKGQHYIYEVVDKNCTLVIDSQMEKAVRDRDIVDIIMAQRSEKVVFKLSNGIKVTLPLAPFNENVPLYRGSGWTKEYVEQEHHHGKETMTIAKFFEAKESGVEDWELEMMRLANKRKKKHKGEDNVDWKQMLSGCLEDMDWDKFEEETKQIVEEKEQVVEEENIPMEVNDMDHTTDVAEKLKAGGEEVLSQLPVMKEIPEVIKNLESGEMCEISNVSGAKIILPSSNKECFVVGQMVKTDDNEVFVPGQTIVNEDGNTDYTPGITINDDNEPTLIPGLVMGEEESPAMFLPGDSTITEEGQLKFEATEEDRPKRWRQLSDSPPPPPKPKRKPKVEEEIVIRRRVIEDPPEPLIKEKVKKRPPIEIKKADSPPRPIVRTPRLPMEDPLKVLEEQRRKREEEEKKRMKERLEEKILKEESKVDQLRLDMRRKFKNMKFEKPKEYVPIEPVIKSQKLRELENSIKKGTFFDDEKTKDILEKAKSATRMLKYQNVLNTYGNDFYVLSFCKITGASKIFKKHFYLPLLKPLNPKEALRTLRITGKWLLGAKIQRYIPVLLNHAQKRSKKVENFGKLPHFKSSDYTYMTPSLDLENENHKLLLNILETKDKNGCYTYTVHDKKYNIVFESDFEHAIRDGDIVDIMVSQKTDKILVKLKDKKKIPIEIQYFEGNFDNLMCGEGATTEAEEKQHHYGKYTMSIARIFEEKELREEKWEEELKKILKRRKKQKWENSKAYKEMMKRTMKNLDWNKFEEDAKKVIDEISDPSTEIPIEMEVDDLESTKNVNETLLSHGPKILDQLPTITEIPDLIKSMGNAEIAEIENVPPEENQKKRRVSGVKVRLSSGKECFVSGQMVLTEDGEVFIPGQTVQNEYGDEYVPGITTNVDNQPTLISGLIMGEDEKEPMFLPSQAAITADGQLTFATTPDERPPPQTESERKVKRKKKPNIPSEPLLEIMIIEEVAEEPSDSEEKSTSISSVELNNSEIEELDMEAIRLNQEQHRLEMEKLRMQLFDNMDDIIANLEDKKAQLKKKLEDLRRQHMENENNLVSYATEKDALEIASKISDNQDTINRLVDILLTMTRRASTFRDKNSVRADNIDLSYLSTNAGDYEIKFHSCSNKLKIIFKTALVAANDVFKNRPKDQILALTTIGGILAQSMKNDIKLTLELTNVMKTQLDRDEICETAFKQLTRIIEDTKVCIVAMIVDKRMSISDLIESIEKVLGSENVMHIAFAKILKINPIIVHYLVENIENQLKDIASEEDAVKVLQISIVETIRFTLVSNLEQVKKKSTYPELIQEASSFAKALGLDDVVEDLSNPSQDFLLEESINMLKRMTLIKQLSERDYSLKTAIARIRKNPECAKSDPRIRQLIRESAVLISNPSPLLTSRSIPLQLMKKQNLLAIEDYLVKRTNIEFPVLISRGTLQAVIPKDASRGVLAGRVPYVLIDETGVTNFKPMHMMSAIHVNKNREKRIEDYLSVVPDSDSSNYFKTKNNGSENSRGTMSSGALLRGYGPRA
ncbi:uncharacterized protein LOC130444344 [Diorhabda sublineata]|uniref:uncharacterized protein LOC130444344 n=1 Tax=Diorhabda sublineata TaxID=1163346 RepID=UPI0024E0683C|nr:uncharacterized protein LOC130444344 [Diorhabda sublineata]